MEFLNFSDPDAVAEYEAFMKSSPLGNFMQSIEWSRVKRGYGWRCEAVLSRNFDGTLAGTVLVLIKKFPFPLKSFLYAPWGPVCDLRNETVLRDLLSGVWKLAGKYRAWLFKACPLVEEDDGETIEILKQAGRIRKSSNAVTIISCPFGEEVQKRFLHPLKANGATTSVLQKRRVSRAAFTVPTI